MPIVNYVEREGNYGFERTPVYTQNEISRDLGLTHLTKGINITTLQQRFAI